MNGRRAVIGLSLLCALVFSAFAAPNAMALKGTTAFTCAPEGKQFSDAHCTKAGTGFGHVVVVAGTATKVEGTNAKTASETKAATTAVLKGKVFGVLLEITAKTVASTGTLTNNAGPPMSATGPSTITYTELNKPLKETCQVVGGKIVAEGNVTTRTELNAKGEEEMWVEVKGSKAKEVFTEFELENAPGKVCADAGKVIKVKGAAIGTPNGATLEFKKEEPRNTLELNETKEKAEYIGIETISMTEKGNPITLTTE